ncbi:MAG TPA: cysteine peptidase family C39 domain-containing protein [Anaerohalosphaeraceae bacterium]|nr:cysteine peptidase family C39 domain-containing protein [Anaerohalosphaeraceae bacterium]HOL88240.1 cysteine peptidase family C39 domain-containing protein [Anaerohalosphaeraceae bacterium]HPP57438.1 cysteine peptidase family C39 domain-containing protein [Anaerohalosphaeraceae bacterium]
MILWMQALVAAAAAAAALCLGRFYFARTYRRAVWGGLASIGWLAFVVTAHLVHLNSTYSGFDWVAGSRNKFLLIGFAVCFGLLGPIPYLNRRWKKVFTASVLTVFLAIFLGLPFLVPALYSPHLWNLPGCIDEDGVCRQSTSFTCGPAAAVTALKKMGLEASEAQIAVVSGTIPAVGTGMWDLCRGLQKLFPPEQLECRYARAGSLEDLPEGQVILAVLRQTFWLDHCVAILEITPETVLFADPSNGLCSLPRRVFEASWRKTAIVLARPEEHSADL